VTQAYVLEWSNLKLRFYTNGGRIEAVPTSPYELVTPYTAAEAPFVSSQQSHDRLYMAHGSHAPASLLRTGRDDVQLWGADPQERTRSPIATPTRRSRSRRARRRVWRRSPPPGADIPRRATSAAAFMVEAMGFSEIIGWEPGVKTVNTDVTSFIDVNVLVRSDGKVYKCVDLGGAHYTGSIQPTHTRGAEWDGARSTPRGGDDGSPQGVQWEYQYDAFGVGIITAVGGPNHARRSPSPGAWPTA
jgi:hypothetical protein